MPRQKLLMEKKKKRLKELNEEIQMNLKKLKTSKIRKDSNNKKKSK